MNPHPSLSSPTVSPDTLGQDPTAGVTVLSLARRMGMGRATGAAWAESRVHSKWPWWSGMSFVPWEPPFLCLGVPKVAQQVKRWLCMNEDPQASDPQNSCEKPVTVEHACNPVSGEMRDG